MLDAIVKKTRLSAALALALLAAPAAAEAPAAEIRPAMWKVADEDTTIYLFGTVHLLPKDAEWRTPALEKALAASEQLVTEVELEKGMAQAAGVMMKLGFSPGQPPLLERVPEAKRARLKQVAEASGIPLPALDAMETWAAALTLLSASLQQLGFDPALGVEEQLKKAAPGKPLGGLETVEEQLGIFDGLPEATQREFLESALEDPEEVRKEFAAMLAAWSRGDVAAIAETFNTQLTSAELREKLLAARNRKWAQWVEGRLDQPGTVFVAVGAGHLAGEDSVQAMLKAKGLKAKRVQ